MVLLNRLKRNWSKDKETLKGLSLRGKARFFLDYYKGWLFLMLLALMLIIYIGDVVHQTSKTIIIQGFFVNDEHNFFPAKELIRIFSETRKLPPKSRVAFEDSLYVDLYSQSEYNAASQSKIVAYIAAQELDFLAAPDELAKYYAQSFSLLDLEELLPPDLLSRLGDRLYYEKDGTGIKKASCLDLRGSRFMKNSCISDLSPYYLMVPSYTDHREAIIDFIRFAYPDPNMP